MQKFSSRKRPTFSPACGFSTQDSRLEWYQAHGVPVPGGSDKPSTAELTANPDTTQPLYFWQLYSLLGRDRIYALIRRFYTMVFDDKEDPAFRHAFAKVADLEHHVETQASYWQDAMGGGRQYHGSHFRLKFHHEHNAKQVMNAQGAQRWMYHMCRALKEVEPVFRAIDPRIPAVILDFLETKMKKYAQQFGWRFQQRDFDDAKACDGHVALALGPAHQSRTAYSRCELASMSVKTLKTVCRTLQVDVSRCVERVEIIALLAKSGRALVVDKPSYTTAELRDMKPGDLKQLAKCLRIDVSRCVEKDEIVSLVALSVTLLDDRAKVEEHDNKEGEWAATPSPQQWRQKLVQLYTKHNPKMLRKVDALLKKHRGAELALLQSVRVKYGEDVGSGP